MQLGKNLENMTIKSSAFGPSAPLNVAQTAKAFMITKNLINNSHAPQSVAEQSNAGPYTDGNRNRCTKHGKKLVNFCLDHGVPVCADCFPEHQGHKFEMLENYA